MLKLLYIVLLVQTIECQTISDGTIKFELTRNMPYFKPLNSSDYDFHLNMTWGEKIMHHMASLAGEYQIDLKNVMNSQYLGTVYLGTPSD